MGYNEFVLLTGDLVILLGLALAALLIWFFCKVKATSRLRVSQPAGGFHVYFPTESCPENEAPFTAASWTRLENLSADSIMILEFHLQMPGHPLIISTVDTPNTAKLPFASVKQLKSLITLEPFAVCEGMVVFPGCPELTGDCQATLSVLTNRGTFSSRCILRRDMPANLSPTSASGQGNAIKY